MPEHPSPLRPPSRWSALVAGACVSGAVLVFAIGVRLLGGRPLDPTPSPSYPYSGLIHGQVSAVTIALVAVGCFLVGRTTWLSSRGVAAGTLVWAFVALSLETSRDPTSHNLLPLEMLSWSAVFLPAWLGGHVGRRLRLSEGEIDPRTIAGRAEPSFPHVRGDGLRGANGQSGRVLTRENRDEPDPVTGARPSVPGMPARLRDWTPTDSTRRLCVVAGGLLILVGALGRGAAAVALPVGVMALLIGVQGRFPVRHRWWHRFVR